MPAGCLFYFTYKFLVVCEHFTRLLHMEDPGVPGEVVDERYIVLASTEGFRLGWSPYI